MAPETTHPGMKPLKLKAKGLAACFLAAEVAICAVHSSAPPAILSHHSHTPANFCCCCLPRSRPAPLFAQRASPVPVYYEQPAVAMAPIAQERMEMRHENQLAKQERKEEHQIAKDERMAEHQQAKEERKERREDRKDEKMQRKEERKDEKVQRKEERKDERVQRRQERRDEKVAGGGKRK